MREDNPIPPQGALRKGPWTADEDAILTEYVVTHGVGNWNAVQRNSGLIRCGKSCRLRWTNHLRPNLKKGAFSPEEEAIVVNLHSKLGNKWARIASQLPGRTDNEIKNFWNTRLKRRQRACLPIYPDEVTNPEIQNHLQESAPSNLVSGNHNSSISLYDILDSSSSMTTRPEQFRNMSYVSNPYTIFHQDNNSSASRTFPFNGQLDSAFNNHIPSILSPYNPQFQYTSSNFGFDPTPISGQTYDQLNSAVYTIPSDTNQPSNLGLLHVNNVFSGDLYGESNAQNTVLDPSQVHYLWDYNLVNNGPTSQQDQSFFAEQNWIPQRHIHESSSSHSSIAAAASSMETNGVDNGFLTIDTIPLTGPTLDWYNGDGNVPNGTVNENQQNLLNSSMEMATSQGFLDSAGSSYWTNMSRDLNGRF